MGFHLARQARPTWANRPYQSSYCWPTPEWGRSRHSHLCKTRDFWSGEAIFAFEQLCARNCRCWRCIAAECKRRSRAAAQRERTPASKPMAHVLPYIPINAKLQSPHPPNSIPAVRIHGDITFVAPSGRAQYAESRPGRLSSSRATKKCEPRRGSHFALLVSEAGFEPAHPKCGHKHLKLACLPFHHSDIGLLKCNVRYSSLSTAACEPLNFKGF